MYQAKQKKGRREVKVNAILISGIGDSWFPSRNSAGEGKCKQHLILIGYRAVWTAESAWMQHGRKRPLTLPKIEY
jgi:hypothetical protein